MRWRDARSTPGAEVAKTGGRRGSGKLLRSLLGEPRLVHPGGSATLGQIVRIITNLSLPTFTPLQCDIAAPPNKKWNLFPHTLNLSWPFDLLQSMDTSKYDTSKRDWKSCFLILRTLRQPCEQAPADLLKDEPSWSRLKVFSQLPDMWVRPFETSSATNLPTDSRIVKPQNLLLVTEVWTRSSEKSRAA